MIIIVVGKYVTKKKLNLYSNSKGEKYEIYYFKLFVTFCQQLSRLISQVIIRREFNDKKKVNKNRIALNLSALV